MSPTPEQTLLTALSDYFDAEREYQRRKQEYEARKEAYFRAGDVKKAREAEAAALVAREHGLVTYQGLAIKANGELLVMQPVSRVLNTEPETLFLIGDSAHG